MSRSLSVYLRFERFIVGCDWTHGTYATCILPRKEPPHETMSVARKNPYISNSLGTLSSDNFSCFVLREANCESRLSEPKTEKDSPPHGLLDIPSVGKPGRPDRDDNV